MLQIFLTTVLPIALCVAAGAGLRRWRRVEPGPVATVAVDLFGPALLLGNLPPQLAHRTDLMLFLLSCVAVQLVLAWAGVHLLRIRDPDTRTGFIFAVSLANFGFFGLPLVEFSLGGEAFEAGLMVLAFLNIPTVLLGAYMASPATRPADALRATLRQPFTWAVLLAIMLSASGTTLPEPLRRPLQLLGGGAIPAMLVVLGMQLVDLRIGRVSLPVLGTAVALRLLVAPVVAIALARLWGYGLERIDVRAAIMQLSTPSGMTPLLFMVAFGRRTGLLAAAILLSTLLSLLTLPWVIARLGAG